MQSGNRKAILAAFGANLGLAIAKLVGWLFTGAASMLAEAVHSLADTGNQALLLWGGASAQRPATEEHAFGFERDRYFWSFVVAVVIFAMGSVFATYEGVSKVLDPHEITSPSWAAGILLGGIFMEGYSFRTAVVEARRQKGGLGWWQFIRQTKNPELPVVLLEDLGALLGLVIALGGIGLATWTGDPRFDAAGSIAIGFLLGAISLILAIEMRSLLIGESASPADQKLILAALDEAPSVDHVIHMRTQHLGPDQMLVAIKIQFVSGLSVPEIIEAVDRAEDRIREKVPAAALIFIEPDILRAPGED